MPRRALINRTADFWLLGGASLLVWAFFALFQAMPFEPSEKLFGQLLAGGLGLQLFVNYPHFMASYRLAYTRGPGFVRQNWFPLLAVPVGMLVVFGYAWFHFDVAGTPGELVKALGDALRASGFDTFLGHSNHGGRNLVGALGQLMMITVGWHYSKQVFGCMMVYAHFDEYPLTGGQRDGLRRSLYTIWASFFLSRDLPKADLGFYGMTVPSLGIPEVFDTLAVLLWIAACGWFYLRVIRHNRIHHGKGPSANFLVPAIAFSVWWIPWLTNFSYQYIFVPLFHSLQYLAFVYKVERGLYESEPLGSPEAHTGRLAAGLILAGYASFVLLPGALDAAFDAGTVTGGAFFLFSFQVFINVHHYFLDSVIWRFKAPEIRAYLLG